MCVNVLQERLGTYKVVRRRRAARSREREKERRRETASKIDKTSGISDVTADGGSAGSVGVVLAPRWTVPPETQASMFLPPPPIQPPLPCPASAEPDPDSCEILRTREGEREAERG